MIQTLGITVVVEGILCLAYAAWRKKTIWPILLTSVFANMLTQSMLWVALNFFFQSYLTTLLMAEILIWLIEGLLYFGLRLNRLGLEEALLLSLLINLSSFGFGWYLPI